MSRAHHGVIGEPMTAKGNSKIDTLTALPGIGAVTAKKLISAKIDTVSKVASAGSKKLQDAGLSAAVAKKVGAAAKVADKASVTVKKVASKAKTATKSTAKKSSSAAKTAASKTKTAAKKATSKTKAAAKKTASKTKTAAKKATSKTKAAAKKVSKKAGDVKKSTLAKTKKAVKPSKSSDGRKGSTLRVPRNVTDMPWFNKK
jgi:hypothetical protein